MFTTLCVIKPEGRRRLFRRRKVLTDAVSFGENTFYTSRLISNRDDNKAFIAKFIKDCRVPVIQSEDRITEEFKYNILISTIFKYCKDCPEIAVYDPSGSISFLLPRIISRSKAVYVFTKNSEYQDLNDYIFSQIGAAAIISDNIYSLKAADAVISSEKLTHNIHIPVFGKHNWFVNGCTPVFECDFPSALPEYADTFSVAAGICKYFGAKSLYYGYCEQLSCKNIKINSENLIGCK